MRTKGLTQHILVITLSGMLITGTHSKLAQAAPGCAPPPPPVRFLNLPRFYKDKAGTIIDGNAKAQHKRMVRPLVTFLRKISSNADKSLTRRKPAKAAAAAAAQCALSWLEFWAHGDALLGSMGTKQGEYQRKWDMTGIALSYLKLRRFTTASQRAVIDPWLRKLADRARVFFDDSARRRNNHWYWLGLGVGATGLATNSPRHWRMARNIMRDAARDIGKNGTLDFELARKKLALKYHAFSAMPLVVLAELAASRGQNWYGFGDGALHRLVAVTAKGLQDPDRFNRLTGYVQKQPVNPGAGWLPLYAKRFPGRLDGSLPGMKTGHRWLGGSVLTLSDVLMKRH